jgi:hypothetical protein
MENDVMTKVTIQRLPNDPVCLRISIGGGTKIGGYYCTYRGTIREAKKALEAIYLTMQYMQEQKIEPEIEVNFPPNMEKQ